MITQQRPMYPWGAVIWSAFLLAAIPVIVAIIVSVGYGVVIGFQTRGDPVAIDAAVQGLAASAWYRALPEIVLALVAFQRGIHFSRLGDDTARALVGAVLLTVVLNALLAMALFGLSADTPLSLAVDAVIMLALGFLGERLGQRMRDEGRTSNYSQ